MERRRHHILDGLPLPRKITKRELAIIEASYNCEIEGVDSYEDRKTFAQDMLKVARSALKLRRIFEIVCNGYPKEVIRWKGELMYRYNIEDPKLRAKCERDEPRLEKKIAKILSRWGCRWIIQADPRGPSIRVSFGPDDTSPDNFLGHHTHLIN